MATSALTEWHYRETLTRCTHYLCTEYSIPCQVDELLVCMISNGVIDEGDSLYITETVHTRDKLQQLFTLIKDAKLRPVSEVFDIMLDHLSGDENRLDIPNKLRETLNDMSKLDPSEEEELYERVKRIEESFMYVSPFEVQQSLKMILTDCALWQKTRVSSPGIQDVNKTDTQTMPVVSEDLEDSRVQSVPIHSALMQSAMTDDLQTLVKINHNSPSYDVVNEVNTKQQSVLSIACQNASGEFVRMLLSNDQIDVNRRDVAGMTAFIHSIIRGDVDVIDCLLECDRLDVNIRDDNRLSYIWYICGKVMAKQLVSSLKVHKDRTELVKVMDKFGDFPHDLNWDRIENVVTLLLSSAKVDKVELLEYMLLVGNERIVSLILQNHNVDITADNVENVILMMITSHNSRIVKIVVRSDKIPFGCLDECSVNTILKHASRQSTDDVHELMVAVTKGLNDKALSLAMCLVALDSLHTFVMCQILEHHNMSSLNMRDRNGNNVLMLVCKYGSYKLISELFKYVKTHRFLANHKNTKQQTVLMLSFKNNSKDKKITHTEKNIKMLVIS